MKAIVAALIVTVCAASAAQAECRGAQVRLEVARDGAVFWNGQVFKSPQQMIDRFRQEARSPQQPKILFLPAVGVPVSTGYAVLEEAQKAGLECIAFSGYESRREN
jgi:biopolymer transport protein ExbD